MRGEEEERAVKVRKWKQRRNFADRMSLPFSFASVKRHDKRVGARSPVTCAPPSPREFSLIALPRVDLLFVNKPSFVRMTKVPFSISIEPTPVMSIILFVFFREEID